MYFYCWVELCTNGVECAQPCAIIREYITGYIFPSYEYELRLCGRLPPLVPTASEGERLKREATSTSDWVQLVSLGPLLLGQNATEVEDDQCVNRQTSKSTVCMEYDDGKR